MKKSLMFFSVLLMASTAIADSFWDHNGSTMRLQDYGNKRVFTYEYPSVKMQKAGVHQGDVLFNGFKKGDKYYGTARVFSKYCDDSLPYKVNGNVYSGPKVVLIGTRDSYSAGCIPNGRKVTDKLVFTYISSE
ncbi:hypothetical protein ES754_05215 [Psychrobacter frigidicola]|uniref:YkuD domain-containing protein n=1 Tax=Psychrobacter frigidicola TaxID=45611 RepID=A0A5C7A3X0_9GAMM|nr:hypothetical protein [Psychrobacter frigidicola]TXD98327.1 hypothetical protein ES754_05215 [Psychrobacter frigidicola]